MDPLPKDAQSFEAAPIQPRQPMFGWAAISLSLLPVCNDWNWFAGIRLFQGAEIRVQPHSLVGLKSSHGSRQLDFARIGAFQDARTNPEGRLRGHRWR